MEWIRPKRETMRRTSWLKLTVRALLLVALSGALVVNSVACPLSMGLPGSGSMPSGSNPASDACHHKSSQQCRLSICDAGASYLAPYVSRNVPLLQELPSGVIVPSSLWTLLHSSPVVRPTGAPPGLVGARFLLTHSLLI